MAEETVNLEVSLTKKVNTRDYSGDVISDFVKRMDKEWKLEDRPDLVASMKSNLQGALYPYYVTSTHPEDVDWSKKKKKKNVADKPMGKYNKYMTIHTYDIDLVSIPFRERSKKIGMLWKAHPEDHNKYENMTVEEFREKLVTQFENLKQNGVFDQKKYDEKMKKLDHNMEIQQMLENKQRIKKEESERNKPSSVLEENVTENATNEVAQPEPVIEVPVEVPVEVKTQQRTKRRGRQTTK
jgi:hypothetical protein